MSDYGKYTGWLQLAAGLSAIFLQVWGAIHGQHWDAGQTVLSGGVAANGVVRTTGR